jgi:integrase
LAKKANKTIEVTDEMFLSCNKFNRDIITEYLENATHLSPKSHKQYLSSLRIYAYWIKQNCNDKSIIEVRSRDYMRFQNWMVNNGLSAAVVKIRRSAVSNLNNYLMIYYEEEYPTFRNYINKQIKVPVTGFVHKKEPLTPDEYIHLCNELEKREEWQKLAYLKFTYITGCRREESRQLLKEVVDYQPIKKMVKVKDDDGNQTETEITKYKTHEIRCKGASVVGKVRKLEFDQDAMDAIKKWLEIRGEDDCPYVFISHYKGKVRQVSATTFNRWCGNLFAEIIGRRVHTHLFRE